MAPASADAMRGYSVWTYITFMGCVVLLAAAFALTNGQRAEARTGLVLAAAIIIFSEWARWRARAKR